MHLNLKAKGQFHMSNIVLLQNEDIFTILAKQKKDN